MRLLTPLVFCCTLLVLGFAPVSAQVVSFSSTDSDTLACGETFSVDVEITSEIASVRGFTLSITYDGDEVAPVFNGSNYSTKGALVTGASCSSLLFDSIIDGGGSDDTLRVDVALLGCDLSGPGTIASIEFEAAITGVPTFVSSIAINPGATSFRDSGNQEISFSAGSPATFTSECNLPPVAVDDSGIGFTTDEDTTFTTASVLLNDSDPDLADTVTRTGYDVTGTLGLVSLGVNGTFSYDPPENFNGTDSFIYFVTDGVLNDTATVTITVTPVNDPPLAKDDNVSTGEDTTLVINVLIDNGNGADIDVDDAIVPSTATAVPGGPLNGSLINNLDGTFEYTPDPDFNGVDSFDYTVNDATGDTSNVATVNITVVSVNDPPIAQDDLVSTPEDTPIEVNVYVDNGNGPDVDPDGSINPNTLFVVDNAVHGSASVNIFTGNINYVPDFNYAGPDSFTYRVNDFMGATSNIATVYMTVEPANDPTQLTNPGTQNNGEVDVVSLQIVATDVDLDVLEYLASGLPASLTIDSGTGLVSGQIDCGAAAGSPYAVQVQVYDGTDTVSVSFAWNVALASPPVVADFTVQQHLTGNDTDGTTKIDLSWSRTLLPGETVDVYRKGYGDYPEYDDGSGSAPVAPANVAAALGDGWTLVASVTDSTFVDEPSARDFYSYIAFAVHACSESPPSSMTGGTLNYHLGDFTDGTVLPNPGDNALAVDDIGLLGDQYGTPVTGANNVLDIGPTSGGFVDSRPTTDNQINFEDLVLFSINFGNVSKPGVSDPLAAGRNALTLSVPESPGIGQEFSVTLDLESVGTIKGLSVPLTWNKAAVEYVGFEAGDFMGRQNGHAALLSPAPGTLDATVFGSTLAGEGRLAVATFRVVGAGDPMIGTGDVLARDSDNREVMVMVGVTVNHGPVPAVTRLMPAAPNPFMAGTTVSFDLAQDEPVRLEIFGVDGRRVRVLKDEYLPAGNYEVSWNGQDDSGRNVASGIYLVRFRAGQKSASNRVVRLR